VSQVQRIQLLGHVGLYSLFPVFNENSYDIVRVKFTLSLLLVMLMSTCIQVHVYVLKPEQIRLNYAIKGISLRFLDMMALDPRPPFSLFDLSGVPLNL
jgi:hypothetical protein